MKSMDLINAFGFIDDDLVFDAVNDNAKPQKSAGAAPVRQPGHNKPRRGGAKTKAIIIGVLAVVLAAAMIGLILYFTGVFGGKQIPIYQGMEISSVSATSSADGASAVSYKYSGDYTGRNDDIDKDKPFGDGSATIEQQASSTLQVAGAGESMYYADAGDNIYITIKFYNPDYYDIVSFVLSNGTTETHYTSYMFESGSDYENIIIKLNVGTVGGIIEYTISEIKYLDDDSVNSDVIIDGDTVVKCGVRTSDITYASISDEVTTLTSISFTVKVVDLYSLISYSDGYVKAVLYDGESIVQMVDLEVGTNNVLFDNLSPDTLYQYAVVGYYDSLNGEGTALNYLYTNAVYTPAVVLFDEDSIEIDQESITFGYSWYTGYNGTITSLTLTGGGTTKTVDASATSINGLLSDNDYTLTAYYTGTNGETSSITLEFTTEAKEVPSVELTVTGATVSSLTFNINCTDTDNVGRITAIGLYRGATLVISETNLNQGVYTYSGLSSYTEYTLKVTYTYNLNDGTGSKAIEESVSENTYPLAVINSVSLRNSSIAVSKNGTIVLQLEANNPDGVTFDSITVNGNEYAVSSVSTDTVLYVNIIVGDEFDGGLTTLNVTGVTYSVDGKSYTVGVSTNTVTVFVNGEITVEKFSVVRLENGVYKEADYAFDGETLYYAISLDNATGYDITSVTIDGAAYSSDDAEFSVSNDKQTVYVSFTCSGEGYISYKLSSLSYKNQYMNSASTKSPNLSATYFALADTEVVEISTAEDIKNITSTEYKYYKLMNNISLSGYSWVNISNCMYGIFDGNGYTISGLGAVESYEDTTLYLGLFSYVDGCVINLTMTDIYYDIYLSNSENETNYVYGGAIAAKGNLTVSNCDITCIIQANLVSCKWTYIGGLVGEGSLAAVNSTVTSTISISHTNNAELGTIGTGSNKDKCSVTVGGLIGGGSGSGTIKNVTLQTNITLEMYCKAASQVGFYVQDWFDSASVGSIGSGTFSIRNSEINSTIKANINSVSRSELYIICTNVSEVNVSTITVDCTYNTGYIRLTTYSDTCEVTDSTISYSDNDTKYNYVYDSDGNTVE